MKTPHRQLLNNKTCKNYSFQKQFSPWWFTKKMRFRNAYTYTNTGITTSTVQANRHRPTEPPEPPFPPPIYHPSANHHPHHDQPSPSGLHSQQMWRNGVSPSVKRRSAQQTQHQFTTDPSQLKGELLTTRLYKGPTGFGFTLIGNDGGNASPEFIQVIGSKTFQPNRYSLNKLL